MKPQIYVSIPLPCHENWEAMTPGDKGRYCASCAKTVVDFSAMSDRQVLDYLTEAKGRLCGRFAPDQLERPLQPVAAEKKITWWVAALVPAVLFVTKLNAQKKTNKLKAAVTQDSNIVMGKMMMPKFVKQADTIKPVDRIIKGKITDEGGEPIPFTSIAVKEPELQTMSDDNGNFLLQIINAKPGIHIIVSNIGYEQQEILLGSTANVTVVLKEKQTILPEVCVSSYDSHKHSTGGAVSVITLTREDTIPKIIRKIFHAEAFKVYPNPAKRGTDIKIDVKKEGNYSIQLLDAGSKLIRTALFDAVKGATVTSLSIPASIAAGVYFIRLINDDTKKQYTDKIVVQ